MSTRRRSFQSIFAFDLFAKQLDQSRPAFSSFFTNHVASAMHRYWAAGHPGDYQQINLDDEWMDRYRGEVPWAMARADEMIGRLATFVEANPEYELWIASSMGQGPTLAQPLETQLYLEDLPTFMSGPRRAGRRLESAAGDAAPAERPGRRRACRRFRGIAAGDHRGRRAVAISPGGHGFFSMEWGHANLHDQLEAVRVGGVVMAPAELGLRSVEIEERSDTTAYHVPQGVLAIYDPQDLSVKPQERPDVSVLEIAPTVLRTFGVAAPAYMQ